MDYLRFYRTYLQMERALSKNTLEAYMHDIKLLQSYLNASVDEKPLEKVDHTDLESFLAHLHDLGLGARSQARIISGLRSFYGFLVLENAIESNPTELIDGPKLSKKLPDTLSLDEIESLIAVLDLSKPEHVRNKAMLETLYSCGLRVSELIGIQLNYLHFDENMIRIIGKGNKERLVPIGAAAIESIETYRQYVRSQLNIHEDHSNILFLNRRGKKLTRVMIFLIIKDLAKQANIQKKVSPHIFRHSFATHLIEGGADLRAVQQMLGHESITTTEIYTHLDQGYLRDTMIQYHPRFKN